MLPPRDTVTRERRSLDGLWRVALDPAGTGRADGWWKQQLASAREVPVPASYNDLFPDSACRDHVGDAWYQTVARVPQRWRGERVVLRFDAAAHRAVVWVDDRQVAEHEGGYTPFEADLTDVVEPGQQIRVSAVVDNVLTWQSLPPGYVEETADGPRQRYFHDFFNYAGLHRHVWLYTTPRSYVEDITVVTDVDGGRGSVTYRVDTAGEGYLYELTVELWTDGDAPADIYPLPVGVRTVRVDGSRFLINDEPFHFRGFGKHEDSAVRGKGHDDAFMIHDFALMEWLGANSFRTSHYPYAEEVLEYADRHGIVVIAETAAVGLNATLGGVLGGTDFTTFSDETINDATLTNHREAIRELVARDKNHPSVVIWSIANEPESWTPESRAYFEPLVVETRRLDPTRPVAFANFMAATPDRDLISDLFDVLMLNRYHGWYAQTGDLAAAERALEAEVRDWVAKHEKPIIFTEYGADAVAGLHSIAPSPWTEEYQADVLAMFHRVFDRFDAVVGEQIWNFADFATAPGVMRADGNKKGVFTRDRRPKAAAHLLRQRWKRRP